MNRVLCAVLLAGCDGRPCEPHEPAGWSEIVPVDAAACDAMMADSALSDAECNDVCGPAEGAILECRDWSDDDGAAIFCRWTEEASGEIDCE